MSLVSSKLYIYILTVCIATNCLLSAFSFAQPLQVQNAWMYLGEKQLDKAKASADAAVTHDKTKNLPKAWLYRGQIYQAIFQDTSKKFKDLDPDAEEKAVESYVKCLQLDKDNIYKDQVKGGLSVSSASLLNKIDHIYLPEKNYPKAISACEILKTALPYDSEQLLKRRNVTAENIMYKQFRAYYGANDLNKTKETADKLIEINFKMPDIYSLMAKMFLLQKDTANALSYLDKGLAVFDDNMDLLTMQIDILLKQNKNALLKQKLESALEINPDNDILHAVYGNLYEKLNDIEKAEKEYLKAIELNPKNEYAQFNLGAIYFNIANEWYKKANDLPFSEKAKMKEYETKSDEYYRKSASHFEQYYKLNPDPAVKKRIYQLYYRLGETEKAEQYK